MLFGLGRLGLVSGKSGDAVVPGLVRARPGSFTLTGRDATLRVGRASLAAGAGAFTLTGKAATLTYSNAPPDSFILREDSGYVLREDGGRFVREDPFDFLTDGSGDVLTDDDGNDLLAE